MIIDWSSYSAWFQCPAYWFELYVQNRRRRWPRAQRDDALCLGSLVHAGLEVWQRDHRVEIPAEAVEENTPTRECLNLAEELVTGYARTYPVESWPLVRCEEPLLFPLKDPPASVTCSNCHEEQTREIIHATEGYCLTCNNLIGNAFADLTGLAKLDAFFYVPETTSLATGIPGEYHTLTQGWWVHEYKTKSPYDPIGLYMQSWESNMQASFQLLALRESGQVPRDEVQGILVNVLEKPRRHVPQRTCKGCREKSEFASWLPTGTGAYACPLCGNQQELTPLREAQPQIPPAYYRIAVHRTAEQLAEDREQITAVGERMIAMAQGGLRSEPWNKKNCVDIRWKRACDYNGPHIHGLDTRSDEGNYFTPEKDYRGLTQII